MLWCASPPGEPATRISWAIFCAGNLSHLAYRNDRSTIIQWAASSSAERSLPPGIQKRSLDDHPVGSLQLSWEIVCLSGAKKWCDINRKSKTVNLISSIYNIQAIAVCNRHPWCLLRSDIKRLIQKGTELKTRRFNLYHSHMKYYISFNAHETVKRSKCKTRRFVFFESKQSLTKYSVNSRRRTYKDTRFILKTVT